MKKIRKRGKKIELYLINNPDIIIKIGRPKKPIDVIPEKKKMDDLENSI